MNLGTLKTAIAVLLLFIAGVFLAFLAYPLSMYLFAPLRIFWVGKHSGISYTNAFISILSTFALNFPASSFVFLERFISFGLSDVIGVFYPFYHGGFKIWKSAKLH